MTTFTFQKPEPRRRPHGDMNIHLYISPAVSPVHANAVRAAVHEFIDEVSGKKEWFKVSDKPWDKIKHIADKHPAGVTDVTELHWRHYVTPIAELYKDCKTPVTQIIVAPFYGSVYNGAATLGTSLVLIRDLADTAALKSTIKHELGHRFGGIHDHCLVPNCIMNPGGDGTYFCDECTALIQAGIAKAYKESRPFTFGTATKAAIKFGEPKKPPVIKFGHTQKPSER